MTYLAYRTGPSAGESQSLLLLTSQNVADLVPDRVTRRYLQPRARCLRVRGTRLHVDRPDLRCCAFTESPRVHILWNGLVVQNAPTVLRPLRAASIAAEFRQPLKARAVRMHDVNSRRLQQFPRRLRPARLRVPPVAERDPFAVRRPAGTEVAAGVLGQICVLVPRQIQQPHVSRAAFSRRDERERMVVR